MPQEQNFLNKTILITGARGFQDIANILKTKLDASCICKYILSFNLQDRIADYLEEIKKSFNKEMAK